MKPKKWKVPYSYLDKQFARPNKYFSALRQVVKTGDFTLGKELFKFETNFAKKLGVKQAIGVASGTDALYFTLRALGIGRGDEVISAPNSFIATAGAIAITGAKPVFVDVRDDFTIDPAKIEAAITRHTRAILPVHLTGNVADMYPILTIAKKYKLEVIEDCAQAAGGKYDGKYLGSLGIAGAFSFHPLKILHVWGDGGVITTNSQKLAEKIKLWRNHGLVNRNQCDFFAHNSRLHTLQAAIANLLLPQMDKIIGKRAKLAAIYDNYLAKLSPLIKLPQRKLAKVSVSPTFTTYVIQVRERDKLVNHLTKKGIEVKIHYPIPIHLQKAAEYLGYKKGDFPVCEKQAKTILTLPLHQYMKKREVVYICERIREFYRRRVSLRGTPHSGVTKQSRLGMLQTQRDRHAPLSGARDDKTM